ncbi:hypothetical protein C8R46DRAFT_1031354 [Mycena filopes]|nr:hypothetical protein C8R46DRAFT_1031354 [Mycena filopes]
MPRLSPRQVRARDVLTAFLGHHTARLKQALRRKNRLQRAGLALPDTDDLLAPVDIDDVLSMAMLSVSSASTSSEVDSELTSTDSTSSSSENWSDLLGSDWRGLSSSETSSSASSTGSLFGSSEDMPDLLPFDSPDSDEEDDDNMSVESSESGSMSGDEGDDKEEWDDFDMEPDTTNPARRANTLRWVRHNLEEMYATRYESARDRFPRAPAPFLHHVLGVLKTTRPDLFRQELRMSPYTFDKVVGRIAGDT